MQASCIFIMHISTFNTDLHLSEEWWHSMPEKRKFVELCCAWKFVCELLMSLLCAPPPNTLKKKIMPICITRMMKSDAEKLEICISVELCHVQFMDKAAYSNLLGVTKCGISAKICDKIKQKATLIIHFWIWKCYSRSLSAPSFNIKYRKLSKKSTYLQVHSIYEKQKRR